MNELTVAIPTNFTEAGKLLGMFEIRNAAEAVALCLPLLWFSFYVLPFAILTRITVAAILVCVAGGFALIGVGDNSLIQFIKIYTAFRKNRRILTFKGRVTNEKD